MARVSAYERQAWEVEQWLAGLTGLRPGLLLPPFPREWFGNRRRERTYWEYVDEMIWYVGHPLALVRFGQASEYNLLMPAMVADARAWQLLEATGHTRVNAQSRDESAAALVFVDYMTERYGEVSPVFRRWVEYQHARVVWESESAL